MWRLEWGQRRSSYFLQVYWLKAYPHATSLDGDWTPKANSSLLSPPSPYSPDDYVLGAGATVQRRHSHTGGASTGRDERGRASGRSSNGASASSSRRSSPYPSPCPSVSPDTLSPNQIWTESGNHLAVPSPNDGGAALPRRHSFSAAPYSHSR